MRVRFFGQYIHVPIVALASMEALAFVAALYIAALMRFGTDLGSDNAELGPLLPRALLFGIVTLISFLSLGLYTTRQRARVAGISLRILVAVLASIAIVAALFYFIPTLEIGRGVVAIAALLSMLSSFAIRYVTANLIRTQALKKRVLIYGQSTRLKVFEQLRRRSDRRGYSLVGFVACTDETAHVPEDQLLLAPHGLRALCRERSIDEVVVAMEDRRRRFPVRELLQCRLAGVNVVELSTFLERETGRIHLDGLNPSWMIFGTGFRRDGLRMFSSRALDFVASAALLVFASPLMVMAGFAIWIEDGYKGAGVFYRQERVGFEGRVFNLLKFRSMRTDAEVAGSPQWAKKNDPRVTRVGGFIRRSRIDELPQLLNVLRGQMSFVGPRPERPHFVRELEEKIPFYAYRHSVKPGITGWAQLCYPYGASEHDAAQKLQYDLYYVKNNSFLFDLSILVQTVEVVFMGKGAR